MEFTKNETVAFTGHRNTRFVSETFLRKLIAAAIETSYNAGKRFFLTGMAMGFDMIAAEEVLNAQKKHPDIRLIGAVPFPGQMDNFNVAWKRRYQRIKAKLNEEHVISPAYHKRCYQERNVWMVSHCSLLIALYDGRNISGTQYTVNRAKKVGVQMVNIYDYIRK